MWSVVAAALLIPLAGCGGGGGSSGIPSAASNAGTVVLRVAQKILGPVRIVLNLAKLYAEVKAMVDGKEETIQVPLSGKQVEDLKSGNSLMLADSNAKSIQIESVTR